MCSSYFDSEFEDESESQHDQDEPMVRAIPKKKKKKDGYQALLL
jgi:hypothetical protein